MAASSASAAAAANGAGRGAKRPRDAEEGSSAPAPTLRHLMVGNDPETRAAVHATDSLMASLRDQGWASIVLEGAEAQAVRTALAKAQTFFADAPLVDKAVLLPSPDTAGIVDQGRRKPRSGYVRLVHRQAGGAQQSRLLKEVLDGCRVGAGMDVGGQAPSVGGCVTAFGPASDKLQAVAQEAMAAAAASIGLEREDLAPLLDPVRVQNGDASASYISAVKYHAPVPAAANGAPSLLAPANVDGGLLTVIYTTQPGLQVRMGFYMYAARHGKVTEPLRFMTQDGERLWDPFETVAEAGIEDGDKIEVMLEARGD